ncbi:hypothetical protein CkaCkLH20_00890 [Colletotrichum karsti]|uniref:Uncharacterized protein n=1 Tax=Colletotrichum karsti TaxID=1095194 RepID=A0A9P6LMQ1_9PEZI|nr:uncharacterized protein CkaCkLH20_00890 [Colletotrichum karsti]KAF9881744.1 hypothetical protein CkaCkLH20_00890 [Colletotrichum karsti]
MSDFIQLIHARDFDPILPNPYGPPYQPQVAILGLIPDVRVDVPICIILIIFFFAGAALNLYIFLRNNGNGHKFLASAVLVGFCTTRIIALSLRIAWATQPWNVSLDIAATIFAAAGVVLLFALNLVLSHRLVRALHPNIGWNPIVGYTFLFLHFWIFVCLVCAVVATTVSFYTLDLRYLQRCHTVQLFSSTSLAILAFLPVLIVTGALFYPGLRRPEPFGYGSITTKALIVIVTALLLTVGAAYRCAVNFAVRPAWAPGWWHHKACYYVFNYDLELIVVFTYALLRFDMRFHVPDGACKAGDYIKGQYKYKRVSNLAVTTRYRLCDYCERRGHRRCRCRRGGKRTEKTTTRRLEVDVEEASSYRASRSERSGVIHGLSEVGDGRSSYLSAYFRSSYGSSVSGSTSYYGSGSYGSGSYTATNTRSSESEEIVAERLREWDRKSRSSRRSRGERERHHHHHHHHGHHHGHHHDHNARRHSRKTRRRLEIREIRD